MSNQRTPPPPNPRLPICNNHNNSDDGSEEKFNDTVGFYPNLDYSFTSQLSSLSLLQSSFHDTANAVANSDKRNADNGKSKAGSGVSTVRSTNASSPSIFLSNNFDTFPLNFCLLGSNTDDEAIEHQIQQELQDSELAQRLSAQQQEVNRTTKSPLSPSPSVSLCPRCGFQVLPNQSSGRGLTLQQSIRGSSVRSDSFRSSLVAPPTTALSSTKTPTAMHLALLVEQQRQVYNKISPSCMPSSSITITNDNDAVSTSDSMVAYCWMCIEREKDDRKLASKLAAALSAMDLSATNDDDSTNTDIVLVGTPKTKTTSSNFHESDINKGNNLTVPTADCLLALAQQTHRQPKQQHAAVITKGTDIYPNNVTTVPSSFSSLSSYPVYIGDYNINGQRHTSHGELVWKNGNRYVGTFANGKRSGQGTFFFHDGSEFTGDWYNDQMHGRGQRKYPNGDVYIGKFRYGKRWDDGPNDILNRSTTTSKYKFSNGDLYVGGWKHDTFHGYGRYFFHHNNPLKSKPSNTTTTRKEVVSVLEGTFVNGMKHGKFKQQYRNGDLDIVRYENDIMVGEGVRWNSKRTKTYLLDKNAVVDGTKVITTTDNDDNEYQRNICLKKFGKKMIIPFGYRRHHTQQQQQVMTTKVNDENDDLLLDTSPVIVTSSKPIFSPSPCLSSTSAPSSILLDDNRQNKNDIPIDNFVQIIPHCFVYKTKKRLLKKIPIPEAVSIGYSCENGINATMTMAPSSSRDY